LLDGILWAMPHEPSHLSHAVRRNLLKRSAANEVAVVVPNKGKPSRVYSLESYQRVRDSALSGKPWAHRTTAKAAPDPLGAKPGQVKSALSRRDMYEAAISPERYRVTKSPVKWDPDGEVTVVARKNHNRKSDEGYGLVEDLIKARPKRIPMKRLRDIIEKHHDLDSDDSFVQYLTALLEAEIVKLGPLRKRGGSGKTT
jgi:hypothetical protein